MKVLAVDTATFVAGVAISDEEKLHGEVYTNYKLKHSEKLLPIINHLLEDLRMDISDIDCFATTIGPGSFTGLRIGIATIKSFAHARNKKVVGVSTLESLAYNLRHFEGIICPILDAQMNQVYAAIYDNTNGDMCCTMDECAIEVDKLIEVLEKHKKVIVLGDGVFKWFDHIKEKLGDRVSIADNNLLLPRASTTAQLAIEKVKMGEYTDYKSIQPNYIRKSQAEVNYEVKVDG